MNKRLGVVVAAVLFTLACGSMYGRAAECDPVDLEVMVQPRFGNGTFHGTISGRILTTDPTATLVCSVYNEDGTVDPVYAGSFHSQGPAGGGMITINETFSFENTKLGKHGLICRVAEFPKCKETYDFLGIEPPKAENPQPAASQAQQPPAASQPPTAVQPTASALQIPSVTLAGDFKLAEGHMKCSDGSLDHDPTSAVPGTVQLTIDYMAGTASATLEGMNEVSGLTDCGDAPYTLRYTIQPSTITGTVNRETGELNLSGDVTLIIWNSCWNEADGVCSGGGQDNVTPMNMKGTIDPSTRSASGQIRFGSSGDWGTWSAK